MAKKEKSGQYLFFMTVFIFHHFFKIQIPSIKIMDGFDLAEWCDLPRINKCFVVAVANMKPC